MRSVCACLVIAAAVTCSCGDGVSRSMLPKSGGRPYEILIVSADKASGEIIDSVLSQDVVGLPQAEPCFDVSLTDESHFNQTANLARNIVIVKADSQQFTTTRIRYEKDAWAHPQMVVYVNTPNANALRHSMSRQGKQLNDLLTRMELNNEIANLDAGNNKKAADEAMEMFGWSIKIPAEMKSGKRGKDFLWFSNNTANGMENVCIYSYDGSRLDPERALIVRDSVMKENVPGELPSMYMTTVGSSVSTKMAKEKALTIMVNRGLWEMKDDAMGGPFVAHSTIDTANQKVIVAEAFIYAPETRKRNLMRKAEAALYTLCMMNETERQEQSK